MAQFLRVLRIFISYWISGNLGWSDSHKWYHVPQKAGAVLEEKVFQYQSFQKSLCIWIFCCSSSQFLSTKKGFTWYGDYTDKKQNTKTSSISLGEITVICRQNPQITTYNHCQVYIATLLSFSRPFSFLNTEQWCSTMQVKSFKAMGQNFGLFGHRNTAWPRHKLPNSFSLDIWEGIFQRASFTVMHLCSYSRIVKPALTPPSFFFFKRLLKFLMK